MKIQTPDDDENNEDTLIISSKNNHGLFQGIFCDINKASAAKQLTAGGLSGWCAGYLFSKVGKVAASALAGSVFAFQFAQHRGYIRVNWKKVNKDINEAKQTLEKQAKGKLPSVVDDATKFVQDNAILTTGFAAGFLLGIASA